MLFSLEAPDQWQKADFIHTAFYGYHATGSKQHFKCAHYEIVFIASYMGFDGAASIALIRITPVLALL